MENELTPQGFIIETLKALSEDTEITLTLDFFRKSLQENSVIIGNWKNYSYVFDARTDWRSGKLFTKNMSIEEVIELFNTKAIEIMQDSDFSSLELIETSDGSTDFSEIDWLPELSEDDIDEVPSIWDLYNSGDITDNSYEFIPGSIKSITIEADDYRGVLEAENF